MAEMASLQATVRGRVQGVFFRAFVKARAEGLHLTGYVRNRPDGAVEVQAEGEEPKLRELVTYLRAGPPVARVEEVTATWAEPTGEFSRFDIRY